MSNADQIRIEQDKLEEIRRETEKKGQEFIAEMRKKLRAQKEAKADGGLDKDAQRDVLREGQKRADELKDRAQRQSEQEKREREQKAEQMKTDEQRQSDQRKADQQKKDDQRAEDIRASAREKARAETERLVKEGLDRHVSDRQTRIMAGTSHGPAMTPATINDPVALAAAMDHPGLTDDQKLILSKAGYAVGEGWHNREAERKQELMQAERQKRDDARESAPEKRQEHEKGRETGQQQDRDFFADHYSRAPEQRQPQDREPEQRQGDREQQQDQQQRPDFFADHYSKTGKTDEQRAADAVQARDDAVSDVKDAVRKEHTDQQVGETAHDIKERADLEGTGKVTVKEAEEMTHGKGSHEAEDRKFEKWYDKHETQELDNAGVSRDPADYEKEQERDR